MDSTVIGMNLWFAPQISEHCPKNKPGRYINNPDWLRRPGVESILIPKEGTVQEWITSADVVRTRMLKLYGKIHRLSTSSSRNSLFFKSTVGIMKESNSKFMKSEYSYLQYHWCPIVLMVSFLNGVSSVK